LSTLDFFVEKLMAKRNST